MLPVGQRTRCHAFNCTSYQDVLGKKELALNGPPCINKGEWMNRWMKNWTPSCFSSLPFQRLELMAQVLFELCRMFLLRDIKYEDVLLLPFPQPLTCLQTVAKSPRALYSTAVPRPVQYLKPLGLCEFWLRPHNDMSLRGYGLKNCPFKNQ